MNFKFIPDPEKTYYGQIIFVLLLSFGLASLVTAEADDEYYRLGIEVDGKEIVYTSPQLLQRKDLETLSIKDVSAYPRKNMTFKAIKMAALLEKLSIDKKARIELIARDGFTSNLAPSLLLNTSKEASIAYLAIEDPSEPWPLYAHHMTPDKPTDETAGPFYLFWLNPGLSNIGREEWPFKINKIAVKQSLEILYPDIIPDPGHVEAATLDAGFKVFVKNCFTCHQLNQSGPGSMGPDLNYPMSPTEYFKPGILQRFIRAPESVRLNPKTAMAGFSEQLISAEELQQLIGYLQYMASKNLP